MIGCENYSEAEIRDKMYVNLLHPRSSILKFHFYRRIPLLEWFEIKIIFIYVYGAF